MVEGTTEYQWSIQYNLQLRSRELRVKIKLKMKQKKQHKHIKKRTSNWDSINFHWRTIAKKRNWMYRIAFLFRYMAKFMVPSILMEIDAECCQQIESM